MRKILSLAAAVASVFAMGAAQADVVYIDTFDLPDPAVTLSDSTLGVGQSGPYNHVQSLLVNPTPVIATSRTAEINLISDAGFNGATLKVGTAGPGVTRFNLNTGGEADANASLAWSIPANTFVYTGSPVALFFDVLLSNLGDPATPGSNSVSLTYTGTTGSFNLPATALLQGPGQSFSLTPAQATALATGSGTLTASFLGNASFDVILDTFGLRIPEPTSLALVGLALVGAGVASRRRKA